MLSLTRTATRPIELVLFYFCAALAAIVRVLPAQTIPTPAEFGSDAAIEMDRIIQSQMNALHVPGVILAIVQDGRVALSKGYGLANIENKQPMNPATTILSLSSTSKSFTATAVMQLVEKGTLSLDQDVAVHLNDFRVKSNHGQPITLRQLLTHTAGFDERNIGTSARSAAQIVPLSHYLQRRLPPSLIVPGKLAVYSNHGYALAGYIVEQVSGVPFAQFVQHNILQPLGMVHSTFDPLPASAHDDRAIGYSFADGSYHSVPQIFYNIGPACALMSTAEDISHFMIAHLQRGRFGDRQIVRESTADEMHRRQFSHHELLPGLGFGFYERFYGNVRAIEHGGNWQDGANLMLLVPESNAGLFLYYDNQEAEAIERGVVDAFMKRLASGSVPAVAPGDKAAIDPTIAGTYRESRYSRSSIEKLGLLTGAISESDVTVSARGVQAWSRVYTPLRENVFRQEKGDRLLVYGPPSPRLPAWIATSAGPFSLNERVPLFATLKIQLLLGGTCLAVFASSLGASLFRGFRRIFSNRKDVVDSEIGTRSSQRDSLWLARYGAPLVSLLFLIVALGLVAALSLTDPWDFQYGVPSIIPILLSLAFVPIIMSLSLTIGLRSVWKRSSWGFGRRIHYTVIVAAADLFVLFLYSWNLVGFNY